MRILNLIVFGLIGAMAPQTPRVGSTVRGIVIQAGSQQPVAKAIVQLSRANGSQPLVVTTGADGRFEFQNVTSGIYDLAANRSGFLTTTFGQRGASGEGQKLSVEAGANVDDVRLVMTGTGAISGRVLDNSGDPVADVPVQALKYRYEDGQRKLVQVKMDQTNDLGEFRLFWLPPGQYMISAKPLDNSAGMVFMEHESSVVGRRISFDSNGLRIDVDSGPSGAQKPGEAFVPVYYPGTVDPQSASRVEVRPGVDIRGIDFILTGVTTRKVRGTVIDGLTGQPAAVANIQLVPRNSLGNTFGGSLDRGKFEISDVLPGAYFLVATARLGPRDDIRTMGGRTAVDVGYSDLEDINVTLQPAIDIGGSVIVEGPVDGVPESSRPIIFLQGKQGWAFPSLSQMFASYRDNGQFEISGVVEGDYQLWWDKLPPNTYIKSVMFGSVDVLTSGIHVDSRTTEKIQVVISGNAGSVEGVVRDNLRNILPHARVVLVPELARRERAYLYQNTSTDESGRFRLQGIPPGDYVLFAWEDVESGLWLDAEFLKRHESSGRTIRVLENGRETIETVAIPSAF